MQNSTAFNSVTQFPELLGFIPVIYSVYFTMYFTVNSINNTPISVIITVVRLHHRANIILKVCIGSVLSDYLNANQSS